MVLRKTQSQGQKWMWIFFIKLIKLYASKSWKMVPKLAFHLVFVVLTLSWRYIYQDWSLRAAFPLLWTFMSENSKDEHFKYFQQLSVICNMLIITGNHYICLFLMTHSYSLGTNHIPVEWIKCRLSIFFPPWLAICIYLQLLQLYCKNSLH